MTPSGRDLPSLSIGEIHVWTARFFDNDRMTAGLLPLLDDEERTRAAKFGLERDQMRFIQARSFVRQLLAGYADIDAAALTFARNLHGKPCLASSTNGPHLQFSVSHSGNYCVL